MSVCVHAVLHWHRALPAHAGGATLHVFHLSAEASGAAENISRVFPGGIVQHVPICVFSTCGAVFHRIFTDARHQFPRCVGCLVRAYHPILACYRLGAYRQALEVLTEQQIPAILIGLALVGVFTFVFMTINVMKIMSYRLQLRVYNSFYLVLALFSLIMMGVDYRNFFVYLALLNYCFSIQVAQAYTIHSKISRRYIFMILFMLTCAASHVAYYFL